MQFITCDKDDGMMVVEPLLFASISTSREHLKVFKSLPITNGTLAVHARV